jgi:hypothetical protein
MVDGPVAGIDAFGAGSAIGAFRFAVDVRHSEHLSSGSRSKWTVSGVLLPPSILSVKRRV